MEGFGCGIQGRGRARESGRGDGGGARERTWTPIIVLALPWRSSLSIFDRPNLIGKAFFFSWWEGERRVAVTLLRPNLVLQYKVILATGEKMFDMTPFYFDKRCFSNDPSI